MALRLYHRTTPANAELIEREGFLDRADRHTSDFDGEWVWFSDQPLNDDEREFGGSVMSVDLAVSAKSLSAYEWQEGDRGYREWLIPRGVVARILKSVKTTR